MENLQELLRDDQTFKKLMHAIANSDQHQIGSCGSGGGGGGGDCGSCQAG